jgi:hypothetical protein
MGVPSRSEWHGKGGKISRMRIILGLPYASSNQRLILNTLGKISCTIVSGRSASTHQQNGTCIVQQLTQGRRQQEQQLTSSLLLPLATEGTFMGYGMHQNMLHYPTTGAARSDRSYYTRKGPTPKTYLCILDQPLFATMTLQLLNMRGFSTD